MPSQSNLQYRDVSRAQGSDKIEKLAKLFAAAVVPFEFSNQLVATNHDTDTTKTQDAITDSEILAKVHGQKGNGEPPTALKGRFETSRSEQYAEECKDVDPDKVLQLREKIKRDVNRLKTVQETYEDLFVLEPSLGSINTVGNSLPSTNVVSPSDQLQQETE